MFHYSSALHILTPFYSSPENGVNIDEFNICPVSLPSSLVLRQHKCHVDIYINDYNVLYTQWSHWIDQQSRVSELNIYTAEVLPIEKIHLNWCFHKFLRSGWDF